MRTSTTQKGEAGFTLIELLVVIIIIGILAAIAIPVFLNQRIKGDDAQAKTDVRNLASFEEAYLYDHNSYGTGAQLDSPAGAIKMSADVTLAVVSYEGTKGYCLSAKHSQSPNTWYYDSNGGGMLAAGSASCGASYATADGTAIPHS